jgi:hypothetical protein
MKTLGRALVICFVFTLFAGAMILAVNASGMNAPDFRSNGLAQPEFRPPGGEVAGNLPFPRGGEREGRSEGGGSRLMFGMIKNVVVIAVLVTAVVWPKSAAKKKKRTPQQAA